MAVRLSLSAPTRALAWASLGDGVELLMRPATTADYRAAEAAATERFRRAIEGADTLSELGLPVPDAAALGDPAMTLGYTRELMATELALRLVSEWRGVYVDDESEVAAIAPRTMAALLADPVRHAAFEALAYRRIGAIVAEGKGSPPPPNGSQAGAAPTARAARRSASRARKGGPAATGPSARSSKTSH